jgi:hypothetical protein
VVSVAPKFTGEWWVAVARCVGRVSDIEGADAQVTEVKESVAAAEVDESIRPLANRFAYRGGAPSSASEPTHGVRARSCHHLAHRSFSVHRGHRREDRPAQHARDSGGDGDADLIEPT